MAISNTVKELITPKKATKQWRWYHGAAWIVGANLAAFGLEAVVSKLAGNSPSLQFGSNAQREYFHDLKQAVFTPPAWAFGPVWITNNILTVAGTLRVLNRHKDDAGHDSFLTVQGVSWLIFVAFNAAYVGLRSPINAFVLTFSMWALTVASMVIALRSLKDNKVAWALSTLLLWTTLASAVALCQALWNHDQFYNVGPFASAPAWLLRQ